MESPALSGDEFLGDWLAYVVQQGGPAQPEVGLGAIVSRTDVVQHQQRVGEILFVPPSFYALDAFERRQLAYLGVDDTVARRGGEF